MRQPPDFSAHRALPTRHGLHREHVSGVKHIEERVLQERIVGGKILHQPKFLLHDRGEHVDLLTQDHGHVSRRLGTSWLQRRQRLQQSTAGLRQRIRMGQQPGTGEQDVTGELDIAQCDGL